MRAKRAEETHYSDAVMRRMSWLHLDLAPGGMRFNMLLDLRYCGSAVLAVEAAGVVHEDHATEAVAQDGLKLWSEALPITLETGPA